MSDDSKDIIETNHVLPIEVIDAENYPNKKIKNKIIKTNDTIVSNENRKSAPKHKRNKDKSRNDRAVIAIMRDSEVKDVSGWELSYKNKKVFVKSVV